MKVNINNSTKKSKKNTATMFAVNFQLATTMKCPVLQGYAATLAWRERTSHKRTTQ